MYNNNSFVDRSNPHQTQFRIEFQSRHNRDWDCILNFNLMRSNSDGDCADADADVSKDRHRHRHDEPQRKKNANVGKKFVGDWLTAGAAAIVCKSAAAPLERVKLLLQNQAELVKAGRLIVPYSGICNCFARLLRDEGIFYLWRGNSATVIRYFPTQAFNFAFKEYFQNLHPFTKEKDGHVKTLAWNLASGSMAGATTSLFLYHLDYARTRLGTDTQNILGGNQHNYKGLLDVYRKTIATDGIVGLYRGFSASILGITVYRGLYFGLYDTLKPVVLLGPLKGNFFCSFLLGWSVTTCAGVVAYPFDTVRRRMMMTVGESARYRSTFHAFHQIVYYEGITALFRGVSANILYGVAGATVLALYDQLKYFLSYDSSHGL